MVMKPNGTWKLVEQDLMMLYIYLTHRRNSWNVQVSHWAPLHQNMVKQLDGDVLTKNTPSMPVACIKLEDADACLSLRSIIQLSTASTEINANMKLVIQLALFAVAFVHLTASTPVPETSIEGLSCLSTYRTPPDLLTNILLPSQNSSHCLSTAWASFVAHARGGPLNCIENVTIACVCLRF